MNRRIIPFVFIPFILWGACVGLSADSLGQTILSQFLATLITGEKIAFESWRTGVPQIFTMDPDGSDVRRLTFTSTWEKCPAVSPDGRRIAFFSDRDGNDEVYVMDIDGGNQRRLTNSADFDEMDPAWSPDGTRILYTVYPKGSMNQSAIYIMNADGGNPRQLTGGPIDIRPIWSPDASKIIFTAKRDGNYELFLMNADGSAQQRLTNTTADECFAQWSPDMTRIVYFVSNFTQVTNPADVRAQVHVMNADGSGDRVLTSVGAINEDPTWSVDGNSIVFQSNRDGDYEIYIMDADGSNQRRLTDQAGYDGWPSWVPSKYLGQAPPGSIPQPFSPTTLVANGEWFWHGSPAFSPDLREMYWAKYLRNENRTELACMRLVNNQWAGPELPSFVNPAFIDNNPFFSADGKILYFCSNRAGGPYFYVNRQSGGAWSQPQPLVVPVSSASAGWQFSLAKRGTIYLEIWSGDPPHIDLYRSRLINGQYGTPESLGRNVNSTSHDFGPFVHPDEKFLLFCSNRPGGFGDYDLYVSFPKADGTWSAARNMGPQINTGSTESFPSLTPDGKYLFFNSQRGGDTGYNPYWVDTHALEDLSLAFQYLGDLDKSGWVDSVDFCILNLFLESQVVPGSTGFTAPVLSADLNWDGEANAADKPYLASLLAGNILSLPVDGLLAPGTRNISNTK